MTLHLQYNNFIDLCLQGSLWVAQIFYLFCFIPQIITNQKKKCGKGISSILLIAYLNAFILLIFFSFLMDLPAAYKFMIPLETLAVLVLIFQRLYYDNDPGVKKYWYALGINLLSFACFVPYALTNPLVVGALFGWINFVLSTFYQLPQVLKIYKEKSVEGFNILFIAFNCIAATIELTAAYFTYLPAQTCFSALRAIILCLVMGGQFYCYRRSTQRPLQLPQHSSLLPIRSRSAL